MHRRKFMTGVGIAVGALATGPRVMSTTRTPAKEIVSVGEQVTLKDMQNILTGSSYMGCGGGGSLSDARKLIETDFQAGRKFARLSVNKLKDNDFVASAYSLESLAPMSDAMQEQLEGIPMNSEDPTVLSFQLLEKYLNKQFSAVIVGEIGPLSMAESMSIAARIGIPFLDADTVGRATPEINQHSVRVAGHAITPAAAVTRFGDELILDTVRNPDREEVIFRTISVVSRLVGVTDAAISGKVARQDHVLVQDSVSLAEKIGRAVAHAEKSGKDPIMAAMKAGDGYLLFTGNVDDFNWRDEDGFLKGDVTIRGNGEFAGQSLQLKYINEHLVARRNKVTVATCPDLITMVDRKTSMGIINPDFHKDQDVVILAFRAPAIWRTKAGLEVFSPAYFGYSEDYIPVEKRLTT